MISKGLVDEARAAARHTVERLAPFAEKGIPIVGLEPSCLLSLRDEYLYLLPDDPRAQTVAEHAHTFEEFIDQLAAAGDLDLRFTNDPRRVLLHGHCHQKALVGTRPRVGASSHYHQITPSPKWIPAAAGWQGRSATRSSITRSR